MRKLKNIVELVKKKDRKEFILSLVENKKDKEEIKYYENLLLIDNKLYNRFIEFSKEKKKILFSI